MLCAFVCNRVLAKCLLYSIYLYIVFGFRFIYVIVELYFFLLRMNLELFSAVIANSFKRSVRAPFDPTPKLEAQYALDHFEQIPNSLMGMDEIDL